MSADRRVTPLLAYALSGNLEKDGEIDNPGLAIYMSKLEKYFEYITINDTTPKQQDTLYWGYIGPPEFSTMINGYCPVKWGQAYPYNYYCYLPDGEHAHTGCVATAVAQLMCTYRYPDKHLGYEFDWEEMINFDNSLPPAEADTLITIEPPDEGGGLIGMIDTTQNTTPEIDSAAIPIAWLMRQLGLPENLNMEYKPGASDAKMENIPRTLENFGYESGGEFIYNYLHPEQIQSRVREELASGYYCIMSGVSYEYKTESSPIDTIGMDSPEIDIAGHHCWLLHGLLKLRALLYDEEPHPANPKIEYYYLCNFGWDGYADGFYLSDVFDTKEGPKFSDPDTKSTEIDPDKRNFSYFLDYIVGIRK